MLRAPSFTHAIHHSRLVALAIALMVGLGCRTDGKGSGPPVPSSSDPQGKDLIEGAIVLATEKSGGVRIYKIKKLRFFPDPIGWELVMLAYNEKGNDFAHAADVWRKGKLTVAVARVAVARHRFVSHRKYRVIAHEPVTEADRKGKSSPLR
jgi:hypothetical protein